MRVIRAGRSVVKNVAGYDLPKLFVGSYGTLGLMCDLTLKLTPAPRARKTLAIPMAKLSDGVTLAQKLLPNMAIASGLVICQGAQIGDMPAADFTLLYTAEGLPEDVDAELAEIASAWGHLDGRMPVRVELAGSDPSTCVAPRRLCSGDASADRGEWCARPLGIQARITKSDASTEGEVGSGRGVGQ